MVAREVASDRAELVEVLDRVLDKGIVIDAYVRMSLVGIELATVEARVWAASVKTYLRYADAVAAVGMASSTSGEALSSPRTETRHTETS